MHVYVVNNGEAVNMQAISHPKVTILQQKDNLGWEGGLKKGIEASTEELILFMNDDTFIPLSNTRWINHLVNHFGDPQVGAAGPSSNCVMGAQNIFVGTPLDVIPVNYLIGFCMMVRRSALEQVGGVDDMLPGGDDLDLSIRLRKAGYRLICDKNAFVYHHGFKTGERVKGGPETVGGWNSIQMMEKTNFALINKHGLRAWIECMNQIPDFKNPWDAWVEDSEGALCRNYIQGDKVLEIGCGMRKTIPTAIGLDRIPKGQQVPGVAKGFISEADIVADAQGPFPIESGTFDTVLARHILEHVIDPVTAVREWGRVLKHGGRLIIGVPNHDIRNTIPMNFEHVHGWTPKSLQNFMESQGWKTVDMLDPKNRVSLVGVFEANGLH
jgi:GT2 family glycosyltransferase